MKTMATSKTLKSTEVANINCSANNQPNTPRATENNYNCANCDIKFDSESSLRVHLQYHGEGYLGQPGSAPPGSWSSSVTSSSFVDTGLSPPPSSNNSNVDENSANLQTLKPLHINNNLPSSYPSSTSAPSGIVTNTPTPPSSAEAISPSSVSSAATMISYEPLPSAIGPSHHLQQQSQPVSQGFNPQQQQQQHQMQQQQLAHMQQMHQMQQQYSQHGGGDGIDYDIEASSSAEEIWDLDSHTVKRYNNASGDTSTSSTGHGSMESPMGYADLPGSQPQQQQQPQQQAQHHYVPTNPMWGTGNNPVPMYQQQQHHQQQQHGFPSSHDLYTSSNDWLHAGSQNLKRPGSNQSDEAKRIKTYQCEACDKWFTSSGHLKRHYNTTLHKNATRHQHKSGPNGTASPVHRIGTPSGIINDLEQASNSISNLNTSTSTLNSSPSPSSPHPAAAAMPSMASASSTVASTNNNVPNSPRAFYNSRNSSPMASASAPVAASPVKNSLQMMSMLQPNPPPPRPQPLPSMKDSLIKSEDHEPWSSAQSNNLQPQMQMQRGYNLYSPDSVSAVNRGLGHPVTSSYSDMSSNSSEQQYSATDLYNLQPPAPPPPVQPQPSFNYHGHYNMEYTNGGGGSNTYMMYNMQQQQPQPQQRGYHHPSDMSNYQPHSEGGSVKDELDQLSVATGDLDQERLSESASGTPATPTDSLEGPPTPIVNNVAVPSNGGGNSGGGQQGPTGEYRCAECNKVFNRLCYLKQHNKSFHNGEKPFKCGQCGKRFPVEVLYQEHMAKHAGDKPYKCEVCPKQFNHKTDLRRHMCLHTGEKPFACEVCGKGFIREDRMVKHSDTHKKKQPILMT